MLLKLIKYEFKSIGTAFLAALGVYAVMFTVLLIFFGGYTGVTLSLTVAGLFALWVMMFIMVVFQRYNNNLYGKEGYLMLTLPVSSRKLLLSKLFTACVWVVVLSLITAATIFLLVWREGDLHLNDVVYSAFIDNIGECLLVLLQFADSIISAIISVYFAITISKLPIWRRLGVLIGIISYFVVSMLHSVPSMFYGNPTPTPVSSVNFGVLFFLSSVSQLNSPQMWVQIGFDAALCVGLFFLISWLIDKKTSLT
jgi:hypothetical protein